MDQRIPVKADVDEKTLKAIADATGAKYFRAMDGRALREVYAEIDRLEKSSVKTIDYTDYTEMFKPVALTALARLGLHTLLSATWLRRSP